MRSVVKNLKIMKITHKEMLLEILEKHNKCEVIVGGTSMWPFIRDGDTVSIKGRPFTPSLGTVVAFFSDAQLIIHRIIWCKLRANDEWEILVHGDASPFSISQINLDQIIGTIDYVKRQNKKITLSFNDAYRIIAIPLGFLLQFLISIKCSFANLILPSNWPKFHSLTRFGEYTTILCATIALIFCDAL